MIEHEHDLDQLPEIRAQKLLPFERVPRCRKCGAARWFIAWLVLRARASFPARHCNGGKAPTETMESPMPFFVPSAKRQNNCAGVTKEHLHRYCTNCGYEWMSEVRS
jgi:hypothetical protein